MWPDYFDALEPELVALPKRTAANLLVPRKYAGDFPDWAAQGFFVFDWQDFHRHSIDDLRAYEPVAFPVEPITIEHLPAKMRKFAELIRFDLAFDDLNLIDVRRHHPCIENPPR